MAGAESTPRRGLRLLVLGAPGSGKGTQAERLAERLEIPAISTGEMLRAAVEAGSELGQRVQRVVESGAFVDDATMAEIVRERLAAPDAAGGWLLDGYPRNQAQALQLEGVLEDSGTELDVAIAIDVPEEELVRRTMARRRSDDREEVIRRRIEIYREQTEPLLGYYSERGLLEVVDGDRSIDEVADAILAVLAVKR